MNKNLPLVLAMVVLVSSAFAADKPSAPGEKLGPLAFLAGHTWEAKLPENADGKKRGLRAHFAWGQNHQAIIFTSAFVTDGKPMPYVDGMYLWNPEKRALEMIYSEGDGTLTEGTVHVDGEKLVHEFRQIHADGKVEDYVSHLTPHGSTRWTNEVFARKGGQLIKMVEVEYVLTD